MFRPPSKFDCLDYMHRRMEVLPESHIQDHHDRKAHESKQRHPVLVIVGLAESKSSIEGLDEIEYTIGVRAIIW